MSKNLLTMALVLASGGAWALATPGSGNGYGQPCAGQNTYGATPCYPTAYIPPSDPKITVPFALNQMPDYFGTTPNYANSPLPTLVPDTTGGATATGGMRKFVDSLPQLGVPNNLGMSLTIATPDTAAFTGVAPSSTVPVAGVNYAADYYELAVVQYKQQMHSDLPATTLRGYVQLETPGALAALAAAGQISKHVALTYPNGTAIKDLAGNQVYAVDNPNYLGPNIIAYKNKPVRVKVTNYLPTGVAGNLPLPVDDTLMGAGVGADGTMNTQNRIAVHLHGGATPWISDGTPHQWTAPVGESTTHKRGPSVKFVPDMWFTATGQLIPSCSGLMTCATAGATNDPGQGSLTFYYTNQQSGRMMFYHDHAYGITRLNVYDGMAAGYVLLDPTEQDLANGTNLSGANPGLAKLPDGAGIPLVIQDKTWVDPANLANEDPTWVWGSKPASGTTPAVATAGDLWYPHVYMTNQHPSSASGVNDLGRWDYNTWIYPPITTQIIGPISNPYYDPINAPNEPSLIPGIPRPTSVPEGFMDSTVVNGTAYPYLNLTPSAHRFKLLSVGDDRTLSLSWWVADPVGATVLNGGTGYTAPTVTLSGGWATGVTGTDATMSATISGTVNNITLTNPGAGYIANPVVTLVGGGGSGASAVASIIPNSGGQIAITVTNGGVGYTSAPTVSISGVAGTAAVATSTITNVITDVTVVTPPNPPYTQAPKVTITDGTGSGAIVMTSPNSEIKMVPAALNPAYPPTWPTDGRNGGVPDPTVSGPTFTQLANEAGWLALPQTIANQPVTYEQSRRVIFTLNVKEHSLVLGPAERADVLVDFSQFVGKTVILYNDAPAPYPAFDERYDLYTGSPDNTFQGGAPSTLPGYGPNTRTIMQVNVCDPAITDTTSKYYCTDRTATVQPYNTAALLQSWPSIYNTAQDKPLVPESYHGFALGNNNIPDQAPHLTDATFTFFPWDPSTNALSTTAVTLPVQDKAIIENWDMEYGRMNALIGGALPNLGPQAGVAQPLSYFNPPTEIVQPAFAPFPMVGTAGDSTQIWRLDHQGVDQHYLHFHLVNVQVLGRVAIDGTAFPMDETEMGVKEVVRLTPTLDTFVALRAYQPTLPWNLPNSVRPLDPASPVGVTMTDSAGATLTNDMTDYGMEYVFHCHLLGHEEHDMMRPMVMVMPLAITAPVLPNATLNQAYTPVSYTATGGLTNVNGVTPYSFTISAGALPTGMNLTAAGSLRGTPTVSGTFNFTVKVTDGQTPAATKTIAQTLQVVAAPVITQTTVPNGTLRVAYSTTLTATGGAGTYSWTKGTGTLPPGLTLSGAGVLSGTPTTAGTYTFQVIVADINGLQGNRSYTMTVIDPNAVTLVAPTGLTAAITSATQETLSWTNTSTNETGYQVQYSINGGGTWTNVAATFTPSATPGPGTAMTGTVTLTLGANNYSWRVMALNGATLGPASNIATINLSGVPTAPTGLTVVSGGRGAPYTITASWTDGSPNNTGFVIQRCTANSTVTNTLCTAGLNWTNATVAPAVGPNSTTTVLTGLTRNSRYRVRIAAVNAKGTSSWVTSTTPVAAQ